LVHRVIGFVCLATQISIPYFILQKSRRPYYFIIF